MTTSGSAFCAPSHSFVAPAYAGRAAVTLRGQSRQRDFPGQPDQVAHCRSFVLRALMNADYAYDAELLTSELATNAIRHTASGGPSGTFQITIFWHARAVIVAVTDRGALTIPALPTPGAMDPAGRGLLLVNALASQWGFHGNHRGRTVWFELAHRSPAL
jgi:serine/threonine-protein kinase RsbW